MTHVKQVVDDILLAMRADGIPEQEKGLWNVRKFDIKKYILSPDKKQVIIPGKYTQLSKATMTSLHVGGECVMADYEAELRKHLEFILKAKGSVLVTGLGLGCVVRGLLKKPEVTSIDIVEKEQVVIDMVWPYMPKDGRMHLHKANALRFNGNGRTSWEYAWHDIYTEGNIGLAKKHTQLICRFNKKVKYQGAWNFPRELKKYCNLIA